MSRRTPPVITKLDELPALLTALEVAGVLRTSEDSIYQRISRGQLTKRDALLSSCFQAEPRRSGHLYDG